MSYQAQQRCQITKAREQTSSLVEHEARTDGLPRCGTPVLPWHGHEMVATPHGPGPVTCGRCVAVSANGAR